MSLECLIVGNERLKILVSDTGQGIAEDKYHLVFEAFERLDFEESNVRGTGIGLTVTKRIVESMGGEIGFSSVVGEGSTFWFPLPLATETP